MNDIRTAVVAAVPPAAVSQDIHDHDETSTAKVAPDACGFGALACADDDGAGRSEVVAASRGTDRAGPDHDHDHDLDLDGESSPRHSRSRHPSADGSGGLKVYNAADEGWEEWPSHGSAHHPPKGGTDGGLDGTAGLHQFASDSYKKSFDGDFEENGFPQLSLPVPTLAKADVNDVNDDALAQALAEQDLPPGVSAVEQQEIMMRLLTQRIRRGRMAFASSDRLDAGGAGGWANESALPEALEERLRDFRFAQKKRRETYGDERPWGILGLYDHLAGIRNDVEWSEDAAWRRAHKEPYLSWSDFQKTRTDVWNRPLFTYMLLAVCTGVLIASFGLNGWVVEPLSVNPMIGPSAETLIRMGAKQTSLIVNQGEWYRLFSPMVLHAGVIHYFLNMLALWFIGRAVEQCHGFAAAAIIFIIPAVGGTILSAIFLPEYISVGASGGIFGLIGACVADIAINWSLLFGEHVNSHENGSRSRHIKVLLWLFFDIVLNCLVGLTPFVDNFTHLGGMAYGFLCGLSTMERLSTDFFGIATSFLSRLRNVVVRFSGLILSVVLIMVTTALLVESDGGTSPCSSCRYVSCVPFPPWEGPEDKWWYCDDCATVAADAKLDSSGYYSLSLTCPDGAIEDIDLVDQLVTDREWIRKQLPSFCRKHCENLFFS